MVLLGQFGNSRYIAGVDINDAYMQISYAVPATGTVETISSVAGEEAYNIPTALCKRSGVNQWYYGREALEAEGEENILVTDLLALALDGESVIIEEEAFDPLALLALFFRRCMSLLEREMPLEKMDALMITCEELSARKIEVLEQVVERSRLKVKKVFFQSYAESFFHYMMQQPEELWLTKAELFHYQGDRMDVYQMECNRNTRPVAVFVDRVQTPFPPYEPMPEQEPLRAEKGRKLDSAFWRIAQQAVHNCAVASVYLIGEHFEQEWMQESLRFLYRGRRIFLGNNLFGKGACYGMLALLEREKEKEYVFLGSDKLKSNIGMYLSERGEEVYFAILNAGENWYEAERTMEVYLHDGNLLEILITSLTGRGSARARISLEELQSDLTRVRLHFYLEEETRLIVEITDLGLGELREGSGKTWQEEINL